MLSTINVKSKPAAYLAVLFIAIVAAGSQNSLAATSVSQFGITWTFDKDYTVGQFANGDYYVVGPVTIQSINPPSTNSGGRVKNGSQVNPDPTKSTQGYDSSAVENPYDATLNKALNLPLTLAAGSSLVSTISTDSAGASPTQIKGAAILTVLSSAPPAGSFRPPYCGTNKTIKFNKSQLDYSKLASLAPTSSYPRLKQQAGDSQGSSVERMFERPWIDHIPYWVGRSMHPSDNMPDYGRDMSEQVGIGALSLLISYTNTEKETLMIRFVQLGIDNYGVIANGGTKNWTAQCGHSSSRKWPILFAGIVLNDADMKAIGTDTRFANSYSQYACFGEDAQTFYVNKVYNDYTSADFGLPEYGDYHDNDPTGDKRFWDETGYRCCCTATSWTGYILAAHIMGAKTLWNHDALFDYQDRFMSVEKEWRCQSAFCCEMWDRYRANYGCVWTRTNPNDIYSNGSNNCDSNSPPANQAPTANAGSDQTVTDTDNNGSQAVTLNGSGSSDTDGSITSYVWKEGTTQIATGITPSVILAVGTHTVTLTVTDNGGLTSTDTVVITVNAPGNQAPTANAGPDQTVTDTDNNGSQQVTLNGSGSSDAGGSITSYLWTEGSTQIATGVSPTVTLTVGTHTITLTVTDNGGLTGTDKVVITVHAPANKAPTANAGSDQTVTDTDNNGSHSVTLNGSASSDSDGTIASYVWKEGTTQIATGVSSTVTLTVGTHTITLTVTDNGGLTGTDTIIITVKVPTNQPPNANAGRDQTVTDTDNDGSQAVTLIGSGSSDSDGSITSYVWKEGSTQIATGVRPSVTRTVGTHTITLTVTDNGGLTATDTVVITVKAPANQTPTANAGPDQTVTDSDNNGSHRVTLNGSGSSDSDGSIVSYVWKEGSTQIATGVNPSITLSADAHTITLTITDNGGLTASDTVVITIVPPKDTTPPSILSVTAAGSTLEIIFSETLNQASATNISHYSINQGMSINSVTLDEANNKVTLSTSSQTVGTAYTLTVVNIADTAGNSMAATTYNFSYSEGFTGYWKFNDGSGLTAVDSSENANSATLVNGATWTTQGEIYFDGTDDAVQVNTTNMSASQGSIAMWVYPRSFPNSRNYIFGHTTQSSSNRIQLDCNQSGVLGVGLGDNASLNTNIQTLNTQQWYHLILTWDGTNYSVFIDGIQKAAGSYSSLNSLASYADIGNNGNASARNEAFNGLIDEVKIYHRVLSSGEIPRLAMVFLPIDDKTVAEGKELNFLIRTKSGAIANLSDNVLPETSSLTSNIFRWTPSYSDAGVYQVEFAAPHGSSMDFEKINITVTDATPDVNTRGMIGRWMFDDVIGETAFDSSGNDNTGYLINGLTWDTGKINGAVDFSVPNDAVEIATTKFDPASGTIAMWVYVERLTLARHYLFGHADSTQANRLQLYLKYGNLCVGLGDSSETAMNIQRLENQQWYHIALTWIGTRVNIYINGVLAASGSFSGFSGFGPTADIGNSGINNDKALDGRIDDVRIYNYALSAGAIASIAN